MRWFLAVGCATLVGACLSEGSGPHQESATPTGGARAAGAAGRAASAGARSQNPQAVAGEAGGGPRGGDDGASPSAAAGCATDDSCAGGGPRDSSGTGGEAGTGAGGSGATGGLGTTEGGAAGAAGERSAGVSGEGGTDGDWPPPIGDGPTLGIWRSWDCCKPSCGWSENVTSGEPVRSCTKQDVSLGSDYSATNACQANGTAYLCASYAPWAVSDTLSFGFILTSDTDYRCGECYELEFSGGTLGGNVPALAGKRMVVQVIGSGEPYSGFTLLVPGGGTGVVSACPAQWGTTALGNQYGGMLSSCLGDGDCVRGMCDSAFPDRADLRAACLWYVDWLEAADQPGARYRPIACPPALTGVSGRLAPSHTWPP